MAYNISNLEAYYDRQLPRIGSIVEELLGVERELMMVFEKVFLIIKHHVSTSYGISEGYYGGEKDRLCGTGKGNSLSGAMSSDISHLIFKHIEE